ncbi:MAG: aminomethyl-transferring glycine dehydrogenase subunit GcvPA [Bacillota bacterium]
MPYLPHTPWEREEMLRFLGASSMEDLLSHIPTDVRLNRELELPEGISEWETSRLLAETAARNKTAGGYISFLGGGAYDRFIPSAVDHLASRSEFYTAYTPYQPEISQGTLQAIFEFQTMICMLTGMDVANASLYDGATAMAEGALMACQATGRKEIAVSQAVHPYYRMVLDTYSKDLRIAVREIPYLAGNTDQERLSELITRDTAAVIVQNPNFFGNLEDLDALCATAKEKEALFEVAAEPVSLGIIKPPGESGADIVVGEGQGLGNHLNLGGPGLGFMAVREKYLRRLPGRIVGQTADLDGKRAYVLTLQAREQHIRRGKATSNICSNEAWCALRATIYLSLLGKEGFRDLSGQILQKSHYLAEQIEKRTAYRRAFPAPFFQEFVLTCPRPAAGVLSQLKKLGILGGIDLGRFYPELDRHLLVAVTEKRTRTELDLFTERLVQLS